MDRLTDDYFCFSIPQNAQEDAVLLLATSGVLNSVSGRFKLFIDSVEIESGDLPMFQNVQRVEMIAKVVIDSAGSLVRFAGIGSPSQCYQFLIHQFEEFLQQYDDSIYLKKHEIPSMEELMTDYLKKPEEREFIDLKTLQARVDKWIKDVGFGYFDELTNLSNLTEEVGEVARLIGREYGQQSFKPSERPADVKGAIADELSDVLFIIACLANQMDIDLGAAFSRNMDKKTSRDSERHKNNPVLGNEENNNEA